MFAAHDSEDPLLDRPAVAHLENAGPVPYIVMQCVDELDASDADGDSLEPGLFGYFLPAGVDFTSANGPVVTFTPRANLDGVYQVTYDVLIPGAANRNAGRSPSTSAPWLTRPI